MKKQKKTVIGLTGGIASGKSLVLQEFRKLGADVVDTDEIAHGLIHRGKPAYKSMLRRFGKSILKENMEIDRKKVGRIIFSDRAKRRFLEKITHGRIMSETKRRIGASKAKIVVVDAPLLFEAGIKELFDRIITVWVPLKIQLKRLMARSDISKSESLKRIKCQISLTRKRAMSDFALDNSKTVAGTRKQAKEIWQKLI